MPTLLERFFANVSPEPNTGCWLWTAYVLAGYGRFRVELGRKELAHRTAWRLLRGPIPEGLWALYETGLISQWRLAVAFSIDEHQINRIINGLSWRCAS